MILIPLNVFSNYAYCIEISIFFSIFTMVELQKKTPQILKWGKMGVFKQLFQSNICQ